jgi:phage-related protein (TIGR01555 family)
MPRRTSSKQSEKKRLIAAAKIQKSLRKRLDTVESVPAYLSPFRQRADAWSNIITGLGMAERDKRLGAKITVPRSTNEFQLFEDLYHGDDLARTVVEVPNQEMVRNWITISNDDNEEPQEDQKGSQDLQQSQLGVPGSGDAGKGLSLASANVAPNDTNEIKQKPVKKLDALPPHPGPDDSAEIEQPDQDIDENKLIGKKTLQKLEALEAQSKIFETLNWADVFGGALLFLGIDDGIGQNPSGLKKPLNEDNIKSFSFLSVFDRWDVDVYSWYRDPRHPKFGLPESYRIRQTASAGGTDNSLAGDIVHETRVIRFDGAMVNRRRRLRNAGWADSVYIRLADIIRDFAIAWGGVAHLLQDFSQAVFKMKGLADALLADEDNLVLNRMKLMDMARSVARAVPIDAESEDFERKQTPVTGMPELLDRFALRLAAAARMPVTLLMGQAPAGLNATGASDVRNFYDYIHARQERILRPRLNRIIWLLFKSADGPTGGKIPDNWSITFNPLWQASETEQATIRFQTAQADNLYFQMGSLTADEIAQSRFGGDKYSTETILDTDQRAQDKEMQQKLADAGLDKDGNHMPIDSSGDINPNHPSQQPTVPAEGEPGPNTGGLK